MYNCVDEQVADSACSATAYLTGVKGNYGTIGVSAKVKRKNCESERNKSFHTESIAKWALNAGKSIGLVTTTRVTHASPAGVYAHTAERTWECNSDVKPHCDDSSVDDIAEQLVYGSVGKHLKVIFGGGRYNFINETEKDEQGNAGKRSDGKNLITEWLNNKNGEDEVRSYVWNKNDLLAQRPALNKSVLGLFAPGHLDFNYKIDGISDMMPTLSEMTVKAIELLSANPNGFFLFVEGGLIDASLHENRAHVAFEETAEFSRAIDLATKQLSFNDTLFVATADHSHTLTISGYPDRGSNIFGMGARGDLDAIPYLKLSFATGPSYKTDNRTNGQRSDPSSLASTINDFSFLSPSTLPAEHASHAGDDVVIFAAGPYSHLFSGTIEQHTIPHFMAFAACIGDGITHCNDSVRNDVS